MDSRIEEARKNLQAVANKPSMIVPQKDNTLIDQMTTHQVDLDAQTILDYGAQRVECARSLVELLNEAESEILREIKLTETALTLESNKLKTAAINREPPFPPQEQRNEEHFCICRGLTVGDMVSCDNPSCPFQWFHTECVGLESVPKDSWFCPYCTALMRQTERLARKGSV